VTDVAISLLPAVPIHVFEIWSNPAGVAARFEAALGFALPPMNQSADGGGLCLIRFEPTVWLVEGNVTALPSILGDDGALTAIGGGIVRIRLSGPGWRTLLMEGGVFDAEAPEFTIGSSATTLIDHVNVRLHVTAADSCVAYVPASFARGLLHFWDSARTCLVA
jgi:heterotetrameric sarcosine oxidase gamma subunit